MVAVLGGAIVAKAQTPAASLAAIDADVAQSPAIDVATAMAAIRTEAGVRGLDPMLVDRVLAMAAVPDTSVAKLSNAQPEHERTVGQYVGLIVSDTRVANGLAKHVEARPILESAARTYGVDASVMLAIWGVETSYGALPGERFIPRSLLTLAAIDPRRAAFWRSELVSVIELVGRGAFKLDELVGSWAGAMGHTQFMPTTWARHGIDFDRDGHASPFGAPADALGSTANYLKASGWVAGEPWGFEVTLPVVFPHELSAPGNARTQAEWTALGVTRPAGLAWPRAKGPFRLVLPAGAAGPAFLTTANYRAILRYNAATAYAIAVGLLSDRLAGRPALVAAWPVDRGLTLDERRDLQQRLAAMGLDTGGVDGVLGNLTRSAIRAYQKARGIPQDGHPGPALLARLRGEDGK